MTRYKYHISQGERKKWGLILLLHRCSYELMGKNPTGKQTKDTNIEGMEQKTQMTFKLMKRGSVSIEMRKKQIKAALNCHFAPINLSKEKKAYQFDNHTVIGKGVRKQCSHPSLVKSKTWQAL